VARRCRVRGTSPKAGGDEEEDLAHVLSSRSRLLMLAVLWERATWNFIAEEC
jgi:hypothetical protein